MRVELKSAIGREWSNAAEHLQARLMRLPDADGKLLIIVDELPILVSRMLHTDGRKDEAELLLSWFRQVRQAPDLHDSLAELEELRRRGEPTFWSVLRDLEADGYLHRNENRLEFRSNLLREWWRKRYGRGATP